jgi:tetratricopeptide (TPR) repeat protein
MRFFLAIILALTLAGCNGNGTDGQTETAAADPDTTGLSSGKRMDELNELIIQDPNNPDNYYQRAFAHFYMADPEGAIADIKTAIDLDPENGEYYHAKGLFFHSVLRMEEAKTAFEQALTFKPDIKQSNLYLAKIYLALYRYDEVFKHVNNELKVDVNCAEAYFLKGVAYEEKGDTANAVSSYITASEQEPDYYDAFIRLGVIYTQRRDPLAMEFYRNALRVRPTSTEVLHNMAVAQQRMGRYDEAVLTYQQIINLNPDYALSYYNLGYLYLEHDTATAKAIEYFRLALEKGPGNYLTHTWYNLGLAYERSGQREKAVQAYREVIKADGNYAPAIEALRRLGAG